VSANGNAIAVWEQQDGDVNNVWANRYEPGKGWGVPELVEAETTEFSENPQVSIDDAGNAMVVWEQVSADGLFVRSIWVNYYVADSGWGTPESLEADAGSAFGPQIVLNAAGNGLAVWAQSDGGGVMSIWANRYVLGAGWSGPELLEMDVDSNAVDPQAALNDAGIAFVVWSQEDAAPASVTSIWANRFVPGDGWEGARLVESEDFDYAFSPQIGLDQAGDATVVWLLETEIEFEFLVHVWANRFVTDNSIKTYQYTGANFNVVSGTRFSASDTVTASFTIDCSLAGGSGDCSSLPFGDYAAAVTECSFTASGSPDLTITCADAEPGYLFNLETDANGQLSGSHNLAFESSLEGGNGARIVVSDTGGFTVARPGAAGGEGRVDYTAGTWGVQTLASWGDAVRFTTDEFALSEAPEIAVKEDGNVFVVWQEDDYNLDNPNTGEFIWNVWANRYVPGAGWVGAERLETDDTNDSLNPAIAVDDAGNAIAVWRSGNTAHSISANRFIPGSGWGSPTQVGDFSAFNPRIAADNYWWGAQWQAHI